MSVWWVDMSNCTSDMFGSYGSHWEGAGDPSRDCPAFGEERPTCRETWLLTPAVARPGGHTMVATDPGGEAAPSATISILDRRLDKWDRGYWSNYDWSGAIGSAFYQKLHIALLQALHTLTHKDTFCEVAERWAEYDRSLKNRATAVSRKVREKLHVSPRTVRGRI